MQSGKINVNTENIFPIIKKFLYSDHEIFLRELVSNAVDATTKLSTLSSLGEVKGDLGELFIEIKINKENGTLHIIDKGIGMTEDEVKKYINEVAFSGAEEFVTQYKEKSENTQSIIGHFGLGFYSAFMVSEKVEIKSKSFKDAPAIHWTCDGSPSFELSESDKTERGTEIILHIDDDSKEFLEENRISELLAKYNQFIPVPIKFGTREETVESEEEGNKDEEKKTITVDNIINNTSPAWVKKPSELKDEDYLAFYRELYPMQFEEPLFWIHLNVDYPFKLTGILYFPKIKNNLQIEKDKIQLYQNQVFVTDNVEGIVPEFLTLMRGVIDSPDIPLNVSRSYLQADGAVKKISGYITKKVAEKINSLFKNQREELESKWNDIKVIIEYGILTEDKFKEKADSFYLIPSVKNEFKTLTEWKAELSVNHKNKDEKIIVLYTSNTEEQHSAIENAKKKGYQILLFDSPISSHLIQKFETEDTDLMFTRVDADHIDKLIDKGEETPSVLSTEEIESLKTTIEDNINKEKYTVQMANLDSTDAPFSLTLPEFMRRMKEMNQSGGGGMMGMSNMPEFYNLVVNTNSPTLSRILNTEDPKLKKSLIKHGIDLSLISIGKLSGKELSDFIHRSFSFMETPIYKEVLSTANEVEEE